MADVQHSSITDPHIHEPKGISTAASGTTYVADGAGSGNWKVIELSNLDYSGLQGQIQSDLDTGAIDVTGDYWLTVCLQDISTAGSVLIPIIRNSTVVSASAVLGGAITTADATITFKNSTGATMGAPVVVPFTSSAKGDQYGFTATGNNVITGPSWIEVETDGASDTAQPLYITIQLKTLLNA